MNYDSEQTEAINTTGTDILVSASAGAGKTGVLVARLTKRVVKDRIRVSRILAMTFTQAAAAEMKKRLASSLHDVLRNSQNQDEKEWVQSQLIELESASITTIDSWCLSIIQKYFSVIGLDPATATRILDEGSVKLYQNRAYHDALSSLIETDHDNVLKLLEYFSARSEDYDTLKGIIDSINSHAQACIDPQQWYEEAADSYHPVHHFDEIQPEIRKAFFQSHLLKLNSLKSMLDLMKREAAGDPKVTPESLLPKYNALENCIQAIREQKWSVYCMSVENFITIKTPASGKNLSYTEIRKKFNKDSQSLASDLYPEKILISDHNDLDPLCKTMVSLAKDTWNRFEAYKKEDACMDFSDMERFALEILQKNNGTVADILRDSYDEIMVDEFQDTSELQNAIIERIAKPDNVFRVGDVKQSIYRFRQAKPQLMRSLMNDPHTKQITLRHNFRSMESIVTFSNRLFAKLMNIEGCQDSYTELDTVSVGREEQKEQPVPAEFALIHVNPKEDEETPKQKKALWIARKIISMMQEDPSLHYRSFAILVRSHADKPVIRSVFDQYGIPYDIDAREGFYQSSLCQIILSIVRYLLDGSDTISLLAVLTSPLYDFDDEELSAMKIGYSSFSEGVKTLHPEVFEDMKTLKTIADQEGIPAFLDAVSRMHGFYEKLDDSQKANFDFLFEKMTGTACDSLQTFLDTMEAGEDEKSSEAISRGKDDDVVTVTTIHQSKGLQYGIVFLWSTSRNDFRDSRSPVMIDDDLKLGIYHYTMPYRARRNTIVRTAIEYKASLEDLEEFTRLLYVAVTRAEKRLFIVDTVKKDIPHQNTDLSLLASRPGMTGLIYNAMKDDDYLIITDMMEEDVEPLSLVKKKYVSELPHLTVKPEIFPSIHTPSETEMTVLAPLDSSSHLSGNRYGTRMHETAEQLPDRSWTMEDLDQYDLRIGDKKKLLAFSDSDLYQKALNMEIHKEMPFYIHTSNTRMTGSMDFVAVGEKEILLIDFKTDNASLSEIQNRYSDQLNAYREALKILYPGYNITVYAWSFHNSQEVLIPGK